MASQDPVESVTTKDCWPLRGQVNVFTPPPISHDGAVRRYAAFMAGPTHLGKENIPLTEDGAFSYINDRTGNSRSGYRSKVYANGASLWTVNWQEKNENGIIVQYGGLEDVQCIEIGSQSPSIWRAHYSLINNEGFHTIDNLNSPGSESRGVPILVVPGTTIVPPTSHATNSPPEFQATPVMFPAGQSFYSLAPGEFSTTGQGQHVLTNASWRHLRRKGEEVRAIETPSRIVEVPGYYNGEESAHGIERNCTSLRTLSA